MVDSPVAGSPLAEPPGEVPLAFVDDLESPELSADDRHHLSRVLRLRTGTAITLSDGTGRWRPGRFADRLDVEGDVAVSPQRSPALTVGFALVKGAKPELVVQKLTELGIDRIVPFVAERSVVRWDADRAERNHARLAKVAREASMQARRTRLPVVEPLRSFDELVASSGPVACAERGGEPPDLAWPVVLVGPEGGWAPLERARFERTVGLGDLVLRAETAAIVAGALMAAARAGLV